MNAHVGMSVASAQPYRLREHPFRMTPDARLYFPSTVHSRAYAHLLYGLAQGEGFVVITGEVGAGKTTLVEHLCERLDPTAYVVARISTTQVSGDDLLRLVADAFGAETEGPKAAILRGITAALQNGERRHLLIVDEAQALPPQALEELRMLSNITGEGGRALLQTILIGQPQLRRTLSSPDLDQLRQRILASYHLGHLSREETHAYVEHRMRAVGWEGDPGWGEGALDLVHQHSSGVPRRINRLCSRVLLGGELEHAPELSAALVEATALELEEDLGGGLDMQAAGPGATFPSLERALTDLDLRLARLERTVERRERTYNRLRDLFGDPSAGDFRR
jgi:type II secretory pathway predicted ATPase ExeA